MLGSDSYRELRNSESYPENGKSSTRQPHSHASWGQTRPQLSLGNNKVKTKGHKRHKNCDLIAKP